MMTRCRRDRKLAAITQVARTGLGEAYSIRGLMGKVRQDVAPLAARLAQAGRERISADDHEFDDHCCYAASGLPGVRVLHWQSQWHTLVPLPVCAVAGVFQWVFARLKPSP